MEQGEDRYQGHSGDQAGGHSSGRGEDQREVRPGEQGGRGTGGAPDKQGRHAPRDCNRRGQRPGRGSGRRRNTWRGYSPEQLAALIQRGP